MKFSRLSFAWLLPVAVPLLSIVALAVLTGLCYAGLMGISVHGGVVPYNGGEYTRVMPNGGLFRNAEMIAATSSSRTIQAINLPGMVGEVVVSMAARSWPDSYRPAALGPTPQGIFIWRAVIFPYYCLPFWWFAGLGIDALTRRRALRWPVLAIGTLLWAFYTFIGTGLIVSGVMGRDLDWVAWGFALWVALTASFPAAWIRLGMARRALRR